MLSQSRRRIACARPVPSCNVYVRDNEEHAQVNRLPGENRFGLFGPGLLARSRRAFECI